MCPPFSLGVARRLYSVCQFLMCWVGHGKKYSEAVHRPCEKQCRALHGTHPSSLGIRSTCQVSQFWAVASLGIGRR